MNYDNYNVSCYNRLKNSGSNAQLLYAHFLSEVLVDYGVFGVSDKFEDRFEVLNGYLLDVETDLALRKEPH